MKYLAFLLCAMSVGAQPLRPEKTIPLGGVEGRIDHMAVDAASKRLVVAALGNNTVEVIDFAAGKRVQTLSGVREPQGVAFAPGLNRIFVASGRDGKLRAYDATTLKLAAEARVGDDADNVRYEEAHKRVWVAHGDGALAIMDSAVTTKVGEVPLKAHPESFQFDPSGPRVFANVPEASEIAVIDRDKHVVIARWPVKEASANFPMALDGPNRRMFVGCRTPARVLVLNMDTGKVTAQFPGPGDTDDLYYDRARKRLYVIGGEGFVEVFDQKGPDRYESAAKIPTAHGARTGLFAPALNRFFVAVPHRGAQGAEVRVYTVQ